MRIRTAIKNPKGIRIFYVPSKSNTVAIAPPWTVQMIRRGRARKVVCNCPRFFFQDSIKGRHCHHARLIVRLVDLLGLRRIRPGVVLVVPTDAFDDSFWETLDLEKVRKDLLPLIEKSGSLIDSIQFSTLDVRVTEAFDRDRLAVNHAKGNGRRR